METPSAAGVQKTKLETYTVDPAHSYVQFKVRHLGFSKVIGRFDAFSATVRMVPLRLHTLQAKAALEVASVNTGEDKRDTHLRSGDFFDAATHSLLTFESREVTDVTVDSFNMRGHLTIRGVSKPVVLRTTYLGEVRDERGRLRIAFEAHTVINRKAFGLIWNNVLETGGLLVGEEIEISLGVQAVREEP